MAGHLDLGSDVSIMQFSLFIKLRNATKKSFDSVQKSTVKILTSFSCNHIPVKGEIYVYLKFSNNSPSTRFKIYIINDISLTPSLLLGDDLLLKFLGTVSYENQCKALGPYPIVSFKYPVFVKTDTIYEKLSLMYSVNANVSLKPFEKKAVSFYLSPAALVL